VADPFQPDALAGKRILVSGGGTGLVNNAAANFISPTKDLSALSDTQWARACQAIKAASDRDKQQRTA
jgi:hypothetical protein